MKRLHRSHFAWLMLALAAPALTSCRDEGIAGTYTATTFTYASAGAAPTDVLAAGGSINLIIANDFSTSGSMSVPASVNGGSAFNVGLLGDAIRTGDTVQLQLVQDSFLRDIEFHFDGGTLSGAGTFDGVTIVVTLSR